ncbi:DUF1360 domain-containing protein [Micromonospora sp. NBC_01796]|uniref:DUF1360 domain-containing protein n=1 Tax=Micromonospora sp. NBC_01796 TaxID=2975987 RepID=UPI002DD9CD86|nr:DUF1360 domain-containing protein [Micromonospora sp. NBC_01796]WSA82700.1 DUF1360 domain-containing protein [Micromonospora sp. NBC_01796]
MTVRDRVARLRRAYAPHEHRPLGGYLVALGAYAGVTAGLTGVVRATRTPVPDAPSTKDVVLLAIATHKLSRLLTKDAITSPLRAPFTSYDHPIGSGEVMEQVRDQGSSTRHALGELLSCPFCLAVWVATGLTGGLVLAPRLTRLVATALTAVAASDFLQLAYATAQQTANGGPHPAPPPTPPPAI